MTGQITGHRIPEGTYQHILQRVLEDLDAPTRLVLHVATILGSRLNDLSLYALADLTVSQTMMGMGELTRRHILRDTPTGLDFVNELVRGEAYSHMPSTLRQAVHGSVADTLLARHASGTAKGTGLETAWHLVRAGRAAEAGPHLLRGAREAIGEGAPHEAELALGSALKERGLLDGLARNEANLLLSEVRQELSQWSTSRTPLSLLEGPLTTDQLERARLLALVAQRHLEHPDGQHIGALVDELIEMATTLETVSVRARALVLAAGTMDQTHSTERAPSMWAALRLLEPQCSALEDKSCLLTARALLRYHERDIARSRSDIDSALALLEREGIQSSLFVSLVLGLSALACADGHYEEALQHAERAHGLASRLDHDRLMLRAASNAAIAQGRLGNYRKQHEWGAKTIKPLAASALDPERMRTGWAVGMAMAMLGQASAIDEFRACLPVIGDQTAPWIRQTVALMEADLHQLLGKRSQALRWAHQATTGENEHLHSTSYAGPYARWIALVSLSLGHRGEAVPRIEALLDRLEGYDCIDRAEILCAAIALGVDWGGKGHELTDAVRGMLSRLPTAVSDQLDRLGVLP